MAIKFLYPNQSKKDILGELNKIVENLQKKPDLILQKNKRFVKSFTKALFRVTKKQTKYPSQLPTNPMQPPPQRIKPKKQPLPPPPQPPSPSAASLFKKQDNTLIYTKQEPQMLDKDLELYNKVLPEIQKDPTKQDELIKKQAEQLKIQVSQPYIDKIKFYLEKNLKKYSILTPLVEEPRISVIDIKTFGNIQATYDNELLSTNLKFKTKEELINFQKYLADKFHFDLKEESQINIQTPELKITGIYSKNSPTLKIEKII